MDIGVSFIIPVYNAAHYLREALDSLQAQTLKDVEFICINDGSQDESGAILDEYAQKDSRFRIYHRNNCGVSETRNFGMAQAKGEYIAFMDADDFVEPNLAETVYAICIKENLDLCCYDFQMFDAKSGNPLEHHWTLKNQAKNFIFNRTVSPKALRRWAFAGNVWSVFFNKRFIEKNAFSFPPIPLGEDLVFLCSALFKTTRAYFLPIGFYHHRLGDSFSAVAVHSDSHENHKLLLFALADLYRRMSSIWNRRRTNAFLWRISHELLNYSERHPETAKLIRGDCIKGLPMRLFTKRRLGGILWKRMKVARSGRFTI